MAALAFYYRKVLKRVRDHIFGTKIAAAVALSISQLTDFDSWFEAEQSWWWQIENSLIKKMHHFEIDAIAILLPIFLPIGEQLCVLRRGGGGFDSSSSSISSQASKLTQLRKHSEMEGILVANLKENQP